MMWIPSLAKGRGPVFRQILSALERDIAAGNLPPGARLPPQRELAFLLSVSIATITRVYSEAERKGLVQGHVGRGTFVTGDEAPTGPFALVTAPASGIIDLARNRPPPIAVPFVAKALGALSRNSEATGLLEYSPPAGFEEHRRQIGRWLGEMSAAPWGDWERLVLTTGAQQAMAVAFGAVCRPGDAVFCEGATFQGMKALSEQAGYKLCGLAMDSDGLDPQALDQALARAPGRPALYILPTLQNPTTRTMGSARRRLIVEICRRHDAWIIEDDIYAGYPEDPLAAEPLVNLAPERTFHIGGASKILAPGLRVGALLTPSREMFERVLKLLRAAHYAPSAFGSRIMTHWIKDGSADKIRQSLRAEMAARTDLALDLLGAAVERPAERRTLHIWLPMSELDAERVAGRALRAGVEVTPPSAPIAQGGGMAGLRVCLGAPADRATLRQALTVVRGALTAEVDEQSSAVI